MGEEEDKGNEEGFEDPTKHDDDEDFHQKHKGHPALYFITEAVLIVGGIPSVIFFFMGVINGLLLLVEQREYEKWIALKTIALGHSPNNDIKEMLLGSTILAWILVVFYSQILFDLVRWLYKLSGIIYILWMLGGFGFHITGSVWIDENDWTDTHLYKMAVANNVWFYVYFVVMLAIVAIIFFQNLGSYNKTHTAVATNRRAVEHNQDNLQESEERMIDERRSNGQNEDHDDNTSGDHKNRVRPTIDPQDEEEEEEENKNTKRKKNSNNDPEDDDEVADELEAELDEIY